MLKDLRKITGVLSDLGIMGRSDDPEEQEKAMFGAANDLWEIVKPKIPTRLRNDASFFWSCIKSLDVCDEFALVRAQTALESLIDASEQCIPDEFKDFIVPHLRSILRLIDRAKILARADLALRISTISGWDCPHCQFENGWKTCECGNCGEASAPEEVIRFHSKLLTKLRHEIQGGSL